MDLEQIKKWQLVQQDLDYECYNKLRELVDTLDGISKLVLQQTGLHTLRNEADLLLRRRKAAEENFIRSHSNGRPLVELPTE